MARRIIIGILITVAVLGVARRVSTRRPIDVRFAEEGVRVSHRTVTEQVGPGEPLLSATVEPPGDWEVVAEFGTGETGEFHRVVMERVAGARYEARLPDLGRGARCHYAIAVTGPEGAFIRLPEHPGKFFLIKYKGTASTLVLVLHIAFMFGSFFFMVLCFFGAIRILRGLESKRSAVAAARWALLCSFVGGWPLGFLLNYQTFGVVWEGYPFGYDITDNKTQVMFVLWLLCVFLVWGSFTGRGEERDRIGARAFAWAVIASFIVSLALFVLPHGI